MMACLFEICGLKVIVVVLYKERQIAVESFLADLTMELEALPKDYRMIVTGDFNMDQLSPSNRDKVEVFAVQKV